jgi:hypothetical protein
MFGWLKYIRILREVDRLCFHKRAEIKITLFGKPAYVNEAKVPGDPVGKEWYIVPIFWGYGSHSDILRLAIHEVRHRIQWNYPEIRLLTVEDLSEELREQFRDVEKHVSRDEKHVSCGNLTRKTGVNREIDAVIIEYLASRAFSAGAKCAFLDLMLGKVKSQKES